MTQEEYTQAQKLMREVIDCEVCEKRLTERLEKNTSDAKRWISDFANYDMDLTVEDYKAIKSTIEGICRQRIAELKKNRNQALRKFENL